MPWTDPAGHIYAVGEVLTSSTLNTYVQANLVYLGTPPSIQVFNTTSTSVANSTNTFLPFNSERFKTSAGMHSNATNNDRLICTVAGKYAITGSIEWQASNAGARGLLIVINTSNIVAATNQQAVQAGVTQQNITTIYALNVNDFVDLYAVQTSGGALLVNNQVNWSPWFAMNWIGF